MMEVRSIRYEVLRGEEEHVPAQPVVLAMVVPPPSYEEPADNSQLNGCIVNEQAGYFGTKLPSYTDAVNLPSYEEAERTKEEEAKHLHCDVESQLDEGHEKFTGMTIGTDFTFLCTFILSFVFNWVGFLLSLCISNTVAGYCGALSGLGISIVKWVAIVKKIQFIQNSYNGPYVGGMCMVLEMEENRTPRKPLNLDEQLPHFRRILVLHSKSSSCPSTVTMLWMTGTSGPLRKSGLAVHHSWFIIVFKHNQWADGFADGDSWIWWLLILCGFLIFIRGAIQYIRVKYDWHRFTGQLRRYYFF